MDSWATVLEDRRTGLCGDGLGRPSYGCLVVTVLGDRRVELADDDGEPAVASVDADDFRGASRECW